MYTSKKGCLKKYAIYNLNNYARMCSRLQVNSVEKENNVIISEYRHDITEQFWTVKIYVT